MIAVIDYQMGNVGSIINMLKKLGIPACLTNNPAELAAASHLLLPGVGAFGTGMANLDRLGLTPILQQAHEVGKPLLGICLGAQLICKSSTEGGLFTGLGLVDATVEKFQFCNPTIKTPHMGWNYVETTQRSPLFNNFSDLLNNKPPRFYFVHSYYIKPGDSKFTLGITDYGGFGFTSAVAAGRVYGTQFHPEKSHRFGMLLLRNFYSITA